MLIPSVAGDVPAEGRLVVTPTDTCNWVAWGLESRYQTGADPVLTTPDLTVSGFAGSSTTRSGSLSTNVFRGTLTTSPVAVCGTGSQPHIGSWRVYARYWASGTGVRFRLVWREGDGPFSAGLYAAPVAEDAWCETDLGVITIPPKLLGTQRWQGQVEAYSDVPGDTLDIDYLLLLPVGEGFGKARRPPAFETPTAFTARDEFDHTAGNLAGKTAPSGGVWAGAGDADDFTIDTTGKDAIRTAINDAGTNFGSGRVNTLGSNMTAMAVQVGLNASTGAGSKYLGVVARYVDINNFLLAALFPFGSSSELWVVLRVAGSDDQLVVKAGQKPIISGFPQLRLQVDATGAWSVLIDGTLAASGSESALATGGALDDGKAGIYDYAPTVTAVTRRYDDFAVFVPTADAACFANRRIEFRHDQVLREDSTGIYWGPPAEYRGAPFYLPPAGDENRVSRVLVMARPNDIETMPNATVTNTISYQVFYTPCRIVVPR